MFDLASLSAAVVHSSLDGFAVLDRERRYVLWNPAMERFSGKSAAEVLGREIFEVFPFLRDFGLAEAIERVLRGEIVETHHGEHVEPDGTRKLYDRVYVPLRDGDDIIGVIAIVRDATERYHAKDALRTSETKLLMAAEAAGIGLWTWDPVSDAITWEDTMCKLYGREPGDVPRGRREYLELIHPDDRDRSREQITRGVTVGGWEHEYRIVRPDGAVRWLASRTRTMSTDRGTLVLGAVFDVTERREEEERRKTAQHLELVGQLTAGLAHNFNNLLMGLLPNLALAKRAAPAELLPLLRDAEHSAERAAGVVRELMAYAARSKPASRRVVAIGALVEHVVAFCRATFDRRIELVVRGSEPAYAHGDPSQFDQAILNLLINARDALETSAEPRITIACEAVTGTAELDGRPGPWIAIRVGDNGAGIDTPTLARMYEPFFTTKPAGKGTGLGLATTYAIVRDHGGFVACRSVVGAGTTFTLYFPATTAPPDDEVSGPAAAPPRTRTAKILVIDDDEHVRVATRRVLAAAGFTVLTASGDDAFALVAAQHVDLVLLDVSMPGMSGPQIRRRLRELVPALTVVFLTGSTFESEYGDPVLHKPLGAEELVARLDEILLQKLA